jgi:hypothetical protein
MAHKGLLGYGVKFTVQSTSNITVKNEVSKAYFSGPLPLNKK